ncbi:hypothetical protein Hanom_Chr03g00180391 [Helianthus anomalus]
MTHVRHFSLGFCRFAYCYSKDNRQSTNKSFSKLTSHYRYIVPKPHIIDPTFNCFPQLQNFQK